MKSLLLLLTVALTPLAPVLAQQPCITNTSALNFSAGSVSFTSDANLYPATAITVEAWIRATSWGINNYDNTIVCKHSWSQGEQGYVLRAGNNGQLDFSVAGLDQAGTPLSWQGATSGIGAMSLNTWYHVAGTFDSDSVKVFINGIQQGSLALQGSMVPGIAYPIAIGRLSDQTQSQTRFWAGQIDEVRIWDRALTSSELLARYDHHLDPSQETGLVGYWRFNENAGTTVNDLSSSGNNGTAVSATWTTNVPFNQTAATPVVIPNGFNLTSSITATAYQWNLNGAPIAGANAISWTAAANGSYTVTITDSAGCTATSGPYIIAGVGLNEINSDALEIINNSAQVSIRMLDGKTLSMIRLFTSGLQLAGEWKVNSDETSVDITHLNTGIYQLVINTTDGRSGVYRFVKR